MARAPLTKEQREAVERRDGPLFVRAGAGTGKTRVLVERFLACVLEDGVPVDRILAITFTDRAAAEMRSRVRARLLELGERDRAREAESAAISTIHAFCARLLRTGALDAGLDPEFAVLEDVAAARITIDAFDNALEQFLHDARGTSELDLAATYGPDRLRTMVTTVHARLRSRGERQPGLRPVEAPPGASEDDRKAVADHALLARLLELFGDRYARLKEERSALDFDDLELCTRDLLSSQPALGASIRERFAHVMVDEFQDVNPLQEELLELVSGGNLFSVGDEHQSIYGFRHADVEIFERRLAAAREAGRATSLTTNFRSRPEILNVIDLAFGSILAEGRFEPLRPAEPQGGAAAARISPCVDLMLVDRTKGCWDGLGDDPFGATIGDVTVWRAAEARLLAQRISELAGPGRPFEWGDVAVLVRAGTDMHVYERALAERGIPAYAHGGRGFADAQQVSDLRAYLAGLANPLDELALVSVLASPLAGVTLGGIACLRLRARRLGRGLWHAVREAFLPGGDGSDDLAGALDERDRDALAAFAGRFAGERAIAPRLSLEALIDRVVTESGYDVAVLAMPAGDRRLANVRKLMRIARRFESTDGRDIRGFIDHLDERRLLQSREAEAPVEGETSEPAVRVMTVHAAKGVEFPVVCVADLGREARQDSGGGLEVSQDGRIGLRLASLSGETRGALDWEELKHEQAERGEEEERRIFYVAMTRAEEHLVLSGAVDAKRWPEPRPLGAPIDWIWRAVAPGASETLAHAHEGEERRAFEGQPAAVSLRLCGPGSVDALLPGKARAPDVAAADALDEGDRRTVPSFEAPRVPASLPVPRLSYSALESYQRCGYRFYLERVAQLRGPEAGPRVRPSAASNGQLVLDVDAAAAELPAEDEPTGISALLRGTIVHELLEGLDFARPAVPDEERIAASIAAHGAPAGPEEVARIAELIAGFAGSELCARVGRAARARTELAFSFELAPGPDGVRSLLVNGVVDVLAEEPGGLLIVDYKTDPLEGRTPASIVEESYDTQRLVYALAALRSGAPQVEVAYSFLEAPGDPVLRSFGSGDAAALEQGLLALADGVLAGRFAPTDAPHRELCLTCPGRATLCTWGPEHTLRERPEPALRS